MKVLTLKIALLSISFLTILSCKKPLIISFEPKHTFQNILILGNSITYSPPNPNAGWNCACGMAASKPELDYVHLLSAKFQAKNSTAKVTSLNISEFERNFLNYDLAQLANLRDSKPDLLIVRIGENVTTTDSINFDIKYQELIGYFKTNNPNLKILAVGSIWPLRDLADATMRKYTDYISLLSLQADMNNFALNLFIDPGIAAHPSDKGMASIANQIWTKIETYK